MTEAIEAKIEKLLRVADGTANEHESALALQMAQKLADAYNLDLGGIGKSGGRKDENLSRGLYKYQRTLYAELAAMNHCKCWLTKGNYAGSKYVTRLLGSKVNVAVTKNMADYVENVTTRMVRDNFETREFFSKAAHEFRHGMIDRMVERIKARREEEEEQRKQAKREQDARMRHPGAATENAIVLMDDVAKREEEANYDYQHGEGAWAAKEARSLARQAEWEERRAKAAAEYEAWALANPEEVARQAEEKRKADEKWQREYEKRERAADRRRQERVNRFGYDPQDYRRSKPDVTDSRHYWAGRSTAEDVNLDDQIDEKRKARIG